MPTVTAPDNLDAWDYGEAFNYSVWTPGTTVTLTNVPWTSDYRDIVDFESDRDLDSYLMNQSNRLTVSFDEVGFVKPNRPVRLNVPFNAAYRYNYMRVHNDETSSGDQRRVYYYFILDVNFIAPGTTEFIVQLDVWSTFRRYVTFGNAFVERGHILMCDTNDMYNNGRELLNQPEGFDLGNEYVVKRTWTKEYGRQGNMGVIVWSTTRLEDDPGSVDDPHLHSSIGSLHEGLPNGAGGYFFPALNDFIRFATAFSRFPWVTQGIIGIYAVPENTISTNGMPEVQFRGEPADAMRVAKCYSLEGNSSSVMELVTLQRYWRGDITSHLDKRYRYCRKFLTYPYMVVEATTFSGNPLMLKPECLRGDDLVFYRLSHMALPGPRMVFAPAFYNDGSSGNVEFRQTPTGQQIKGDDGDFLDAQTGITDFPAFSMVNNAYLSYMASNAHTIAYQHSSADWSQQKALAGNQLSYDQASIGIDTANSLTNLGNAQANAMTGIANRAQVEHTGVGVVNSLAGGLMSGSPLGVLGGALSAASNVAGTAIDINARNASTATGNAFSMMRNRVQTGQAAQYRDMNKSYSDWAAKGDYANAIAAINAKVQDAKMIQPTTSGQVGGDAFNLATIGWIFTVKVKMVAGSAMRAIGDYWLRYGYAVNRFFSMSTNNLSLMSHFTYWRLKEFNITTSECPEPFRNTIRGIFEKGVTVWKNPDEIGRVDLGENIPVKKNAYFEV